MEQYQAEATYQVVRELFWLKAQDTNWRLQRRVNHHPSLAVWAGGNELEEIMLDYFFNSTDPGTLLLEYQHIFLELIISIVYRNTKSISYIPSS